MASARLTGTAILAADGSAKTVPGEVHWITVSQGATGAAVELNDSTDDSGTDLWAIEAAPNSMMHAVFDPPIVFGTGIRVDLTGSNTTVTVGYS